MSEGKISANDLIDDVAFERLQDANRVAKQLRYNLTEALRLNQELSKMKTFK